MIDAYPVASVPGSYCWSFYIFAMKTSNYNPSPLEVRFAMVLANMKEELNQQLDGFEIYRIENNLNVDNPTVQFLLADQDGDKHQIVLKVIQRPDEGVSNG